MKVLTAKQIIKILETNGFVLTRQKGSHRIYKQKNSHILVPIPLHGKNKPLPIGTFLSVIKQSKLPKEKFEK
jgi:predicted RNA binding protein YcfA (HicA-like mRNA interferase family)